MEKLLIIDDSDCGVEGVKNMIPKNYDYEIKTISWDIDSQIGKNSVSANFHFMWLCIKTILDTKPDILLISNNMSHHAVNPNQRTDEGLHICLLLKMLSNYFSFVPPKIISTSSYEIYFLKKLYKDTDVKHFPRCSGSILKKCLSGDCDCGI